MGKQFNIDETDISIGPLEKAEACHKAAISSYASGEKPAGDALIFRAMQLYDMAERPDRVLECAKKLGQADPATSADLYRQAAKFYFKQGDDRAASEIVMESGLAVLIDEFEEQLRLD